MIHLLEPTYTVHPAQLAFKQQAVSLNNTTGSYSLWTVTGAIFIIALWGEVVTALSADHTSAGFRVVKNAGVTNLTTLAGTLSAAPVGSVLMISVNNGAPGVTIRDQVRIVSGSNSLHQSYLINTITGQTNCTIEYRYTTTDAPSSGTFNFYMYWSPASSGATVVPA